MPHTRDQLLLDSLRAKHEYPNFLLMAKQIWRRVRVSLFNSVAHGYNYTLSNFEVRRDVTFGRLRIPLRVSIKRGCFAAILYYTRVLWFLVCYPHFPLSDITSNLEVGQSVIKCGNRNSIGC